MAWKISDVLDDEAIDKILSIGEGEWQDASINNKEKFNSKEIRKTEIIWNNEQWLYDLFVPYMIEANQEAGWNLELSCAESFQLGKYEDGGHYDYHIDNLGFERESLPGTIMDGTTRKLSMVCWLNEDFEGGEFEFFSAYDGIGSPIKPTRGTILFFPSWVVHKVHPVTKGTRYSLVTWFRGEPVR